MQAIGCTVACQQPWRNLRIYGFYWNDLDRAGLLFCVSSFSTPAPAAEIAADKAALVALYQATDGDNWLSRLNWLSDAPIGTWLGVTTDDSGRVIKLNLSQNGLQGTIPPALGDLTNLESLDLSDNQLRGEIPPTLGSLANLDSLDFWANQLRGEIPPELGNLNNLKSLDLADNELRGEIPAELGNLGISTLYWLDLRGNRLSGEIAPELSSLANLSGLFLEQYSEKRFHWLYAGGLGGDRRERRVSLFPCSSAQRHLPHQRQSRRHSPALKSSKTSRRRSLSFKRETPPAAAC